MSCKPQYKGIRYNSLEELYNANGINEQQKQQAQQLYSQYLSQNPNGTVEQFKSWVDSNQSSEQSNINKGGETDNIRSEINKIRKELKEPDEVNYLEKYDVVTDGNYNELILKNTLKNTPKYEYYNIDLSKTNPNNEANGIYKIRIDTANNTYSVDPELKDHIKNYIDVYESVFNVGGHKVFDEYTIIPGKVKKTNNGYEIIEKGIIYLTKNAKEAANFLQTGTTEPRKSIPFTEINKRLNGELINNGITEKVWNSYDNVDKDKALKNLKFTNKKSEITPQQNQQVQSEQSNDSEIGVVKDTIIKKLLKGEESPENSITFAEIDKSLNGRLSDALKNNSKTPEELWSNLRSEAKIQLIDCL